MMDPDEFLESVVKLDVEDCLHTSLLQHREEAAKLNREQLKQGFDSKGKRLRRYASRDYARFKNEMNPLPGLGNPDLILTGAFTDNIKAEVTQDTIDFYSKDAKTANLIGKYGESILDLSDSSSDKFSDVIEEDFQKTITKVSGLEFE